MVFIDTRSVELSKGYIVNPVYFLLGLLQGIIILFYLSKVIEYRRIAPALIFIGKNTMCSMLFHVLSFKIVTFLAISFYNRDIVYLASRPVIYDLPGIWSLPYLVVGVCIPLFGAKLVDRFYNLLDR